VVLPQLATPEADLLHAGNRQLQRSIAKAVTLHAERHRLASLGATVEEAAGAVVAGAGGYLLAVQPFLQRGSTLGWVGGTLALAFAIHAAIESFFPRSGYVFPDPIPFRRVGEAGYVAVGDTSFQVRTVYVAATALLLAALATWAISRTRSGRGMQAIASERDGALVVGVPVERLVALARGRRVDGGNRRVRLR
jgi:branched-subunit amino acid ABC-type transport system permease component